VTSSKATAADETFDYVDTFLDEAHVKESFPGATIDTSAAVSAGPSAHYRVVISRDNQTPDGSNDKVVAFPYHLPSQGPYERDVRPSNCIRFTKVQIEAVRSAMNEVSAESSSVLNIICYAVAVIKIFTSLIFPD
jgi:hypothetical protein